MYLGFFETVHNFRARGKALLPSLLQLLLFLERERAAEAWHDTGAVFATELGEYTHPDNFNRALTKVCAWSDPSLLTEKRLLAIPVKARSKLKAIITLGKPLPDLTPHDLRHTHATLLLLAGVHPKVVSERLGHSSIVITLNTYSHVLPNMQAEAAEKLEAFAYGVPVIIEAPKVEGERVPN